MKNKTLGFRNVLIALSVCSMLLVFFMLNKHINLKQQLADKQRICDTRINQLSVSYLMQLQELQQELTELLALLANPADSNRVAAMTEPRVATKIDIASQQVFDKPALNRYDESLSDIVARKYRFMLSALHLDPATREQLLQLLIERENLMLQLSDAKAYEAQAAIDGRIADLELQLSAIDLDIQQLLDPDNAERFALLKDSDKEQHHFNQYALGMNGLFPLSNQQQQTVLFSRLKHKKFYDSVIASTGIDFDHPLTQKQRTQLLANVQTAAQIYKRRYLEEVRSHLDHDNYPMDQYTLLENYTNTEFRELMAQLRKKINQRTD